MENFTVLLVSALSLIALVASLLVMRGFFPRRVDRIQQTLEQGWKRSFWVGLLNTILVTIFVIGLGSVGKGAPIFYLPASAVYGAFLIGLLYGLTAFAQLLGERLFPDLDPNQRLIRAGAVFLLASLLPFVGWFLLFPYGVSLAIGATLITLFQKKGNESPSE